MASSRSQYIFNRHYFEGFNQEALTRNQSFFVPVIYGFIFIHILHFDDQKVNYALISRKDTRRLGRWFVCRGLDRDGNPANFVETEQVLIHKDEDTSQVSVYSHVQIRGSIPLIWTQTPTLKYNPKVAVNGDRNSVNKTATTHLQRISDEYEKVVCVSLIDKKGSQLKIGEAFTKIVKDVNNPGIKYTWFDFHHECRKM